MLRSPITRWLLESSRLLRCSACLDSSRALRLGSRNVEWPFKVDAAGIARGLLARHLSLNMSGN